MFQELDNITDCTTEELYDWLLRTDQIPEEWR